jgi:ElaA protein
VKSTLRWTEKSFLQLSGTEVYEILHLRQQVFVVEQNCAYQDADNADQLCWHLCGRDEQGLAAYARLVPPGLKYSEPAIGRVITAPRLRGTGVGKLLMTQSLAHVRARFGTVAVTLSAQSHLRKFYQEFGFADEGQEYLEDGIPHIEMRRAAHI